MPSSRRSVSERSLRIIINNNNDTKFVKRRVAVASEALRSCHIASYYRPNYTESEKVNPETVFYRNAKSQRILTKLCVH